ncbi:MAG: glycosyltransferase family 2 protein [Candidatus Heimdallarchaeota archaeon]
MHKNLKTMEKEKANHIDLSFVIPALNEEGVIRATLDQIPVRKIRRNGMNYEVVVVDNASEDRTGDIAKKWGAKVVIEKNRGYGNAYLRGYSEAKGDIIVMFDADGTYPVEDTLHLVRPLLRREADIVIGSRLKGKILPGAMPFVHKIGNRILTFLLNILFGLKISDAHSGFRAFRRNEILELDLQSPGMEFASEIIIKSAKRRLKITEVPITYRPRLGSPPKLHTLRDGWRHLLFMLKERFC